MTSDDLHREHEEAAHHSDLLRSKMERFGDNTPTMPLPPVVPEKEPESAASFFAWVYKQRMRHWDE